MKKLSVILLCVAVLLCFAACGKTEAGGELWQNAVYTEDIAFGSGEKTVSVTVTAGEKSVVFTLKTDKETLGEALLEHELVSGEDGEYGLYIKEVNGIIADYDINQSYWAFTKGGEYMMTGIDGTPIADGEMYELTYTK